MDGGRDVGEQTLCERWARDRLPGKGRGRTDGPRTNIIVTGRADWSNAGHRSGGSGGLGSRAGGGGSPRQTTGDGVAVGLSYKKNKTWMYVKGDKVKIYVKIGYRVSLLKIQPIVKVY